MGTRWPETCWATNKGEINIILKVTSSWSLYPHCFLSVYNLSEYTIYACWEHVWFLFTDKKYLWKDIKIIWPILLFRFRKLYIQCWYPHRIYYLVSKINNQWVEQIEVVDTLTVFLKLLLHYQISVECSLPFLKMRAVRTRIILK